MWQRLEGMRCDKGSVLTEHDCLELGKVFQETRSAFVLFLATPHFFDACRE